MIAISDGVYAGHPTDQDIHGLGGAGKTAGGKARALAQRQNFFRDRTTLKKDGIAAKPFRVLRCKAMTSDRTR